MTGSKRRLLAMAAGVLSVVLVAAGGVTAVASSSSDATAGEWQTLADQVYANAEEDYETLVSQGKNVQSFHVAALAWYAGQRFGWQDSRTTTWLNRVYDRKTSSGGYGIGFAHDYFNDGSVNPPDTTYTITTAWHVGRLLIDGYDNGAVPRDRVVEAVTALLNTPQTPNGQCSAYSKHRNDAGYPCIWNVGAAGAWFLWRAHQRGLYPTGRGDETLTKVRTWRNYVRAHYSTSLGGWNYIEGGPNKLDDPGHLGATVSAMYELDPSIGEPALAAYWGHYTSSVSAHELVYYDCTKAAGTYQQLHDYALSDLGSPEANVGLAAFASTVERVAKKCGV